MLFEANSDTIESVYYEEKRIPMNFLLAIDFTLETICMLFLFTFGLGQSISDKKTPRVLSVFLILASMALILSGIYTLPSIFLIFLCIFPLYFDRIAFYVCWITVYNLGTNILFIIAKIIYMEIFPKSSESAKLHFDLIADNIILAALILTLFAIRNTREKRQVTLRYFHRREYILLLLTCFLDFIILEISSIIFEPDTTINEQGQKLLFFALILLIFLSIVIYYLFFATLRKNITLQETNALNLQNLELEKKYFKTLYQKNEDLRRFRHDFYNHVFSLTALAQSKDWDALKRYLAELSDIREKVHYINTNCTIADAIVNEFQQSLPSHITLHVQGRFPDQMEIGELDISTMLSNLLKNAREACEALHTEAEKEISLDLSYNERHLTILTENPSRKYSDAELKHLKTSKNDRYNHGFGLSNIRQAVERYHGSMNIRYEKGYFKVLLRLEYNVKP